MKKGFHFLLGMSLVLSLVSSENLQAQGRQGKGGKWKEKIEARKAQNKQRLEAMKAQRQQKWKDKTIQNKENAAVNREQAKLKWQQKMQDRKQLSPEERAQKKAEWQKKWGAANAEKMQQMKDRWAQMIQNNPKLQQLQERIKALKEAKQSKEPGAWQQNLLQLRQQYQGMDPQTRANISAQMPELASKLNQLQNNPKSWQGTMTGPGGGQRNYQGQIQKNGNAWQQQGNWTNPAGKNINVQGQHSRQGNQLNSQKTWTGEGGKQLNMQKQTEYQNNSVKSTSTWTNDQGKSANVSSTMTKEGNEVNKNLVITTPDGKTINAQGNTSHSPGQTNTEWQTDSGKSWSGQTNYQKDGNQVQGQSTWSNGEGEDFSSSSEWIFDILE